jgi:hypothetical protein
MRYDVVQELVAYKTLNKVLAGINTWVISTLQLSFIVIIKLAHPQGQTFISTHFKFCKEL